MSTRIWSVAGEAMIDVANSIKPCEEEEIWHDIRDIVADKVGLRTRNVVSDGCLRPVCERAEPAGEVATERATWELIWRS